MEVIKDGIRVTVLRTERRGLEVWTVFRHIPFGSQTQTGLSLEAVTWSDLLHWMANKTVLISFCFATRNPSAGRNVKSDMSERNEQ